MKKSVLFLMISILAASNSFCQSVEVSLNVVRRIANQNAAALWGDVSPAEPISYYSASDELIGYRFNYAIENPFQMRHCLYKRASKPLRIVTYVRYVKD
jgi:hypothetical protein